MYTNSIHMYTYIHVTYAAAHITRWTKKKKMKGRGGGEAERRGRKIKRAP